MYGKKCVNPAQLRDFELQGICQEQSGLGNCRKCQDKCSGVIASCADSGRMSLDVVTEFAVE